MRAYLGIAALSLFAACDSIIDAQCQDGFQLQAGECVAVPGTGPDAGSTPPADGDVVIQACTADTDTDPHNCGVCGHVCASGLCETGACLGELPGHVVAIGHDYAVHVPAMNRLLANAVTLAGDADIPVAWMLPANPSSDPIRGALTKGMAELGRPWHDASLDIADVVIVEPNVADPSSGATLKPSLDAVLSRAGVVIVLAGSHTGSLELAANANLFTLTAAPAVVTGGPLSIVDGSDALAYDVVSPYLAASTTITLPGSGAAVIATNNGDPVVVHFTR